MPFDELLLCVALKYDGFVLHEPSDIPESIRHATAVWLSETIVSYAMGYAEMQLLSHIPIGIRWDTLLKTILYILHRDLFANSKGSCAYEAPL